MVSFYTSMNNRPVREPEHLALHMILQAYAHLQYLGWMDAKYCPSDHKSRQFIEMGSTGIHQGFRDKEGRFWLVDEETWPSQPILYRDMPAPSRAEGELTNE